MDYVISDFVSPLQVRITNLTYSMESSLTNSTIDSEQPKQAALFLLLIPILTIFGNLLVIISVYREKTLKTATNYLIVSMASADVLVALCVMPFAVYVEVENGFWRLPSSLCNLYTAMDVCASTASILNLVAISWDRYMAVSKPIEYSRSHKKTKRVFVAIVLIWVCSLIIALPVMTGFNRLDDTPYCEFTNAAFIIVSAFASFFLPCVVMVVLYGVVLQKLRDRQLLQFGMRRRSVYSRRSSNFKRPSTSLIKGTADTNLGAIDDKSVTVGVTPLSVGTGYGRSNTLTDPSTTHAESSTRKESMLFPTDATGTLCYHTAVPASSPSKLSFLSAAVAENGGVRCLEDTDSGSEEQDEEINSDLASTVSANSVQMALTAVSHTAIELITAEHLSRLSVAKSDLDDNDSESLPFIDMAVTEITIGGGRQSKPIRARTLSAPAACNGAMKALLTSTSYISKALTPNLIRRREFSLNNSQTSVHKIKLDAATRTGAVFRKTASHAGHENKALLCALRSRAPSHTSNQRAPRRGSAISIGALAYRFREMAFSTRKRRATRSARRMAIASRYSRQCRKERKATYMLAVVLVVFLACWLPFFTCQMTNSVCMIQTGHTCIDIAAFFMTTWLGYMNSFMNPIIYTIFNPEYRRAFKNVLCCRSSRIDYPK